MDEIFIEMSAFAVISYVDVELLRLSKLACLFKISSSFKVYMQANYTDTN